MAFRVVVVSALILATVLFCEAKTFDSVICNGNSLRDCDNCGCGNYSAPRGSRLHKGIDIRCSAGSQVSAPFPAIVVRVARPYGNGEPHDIGVLLRGTGSWSDYEVKLFYVKKTIDNGRNVRAGDDIGEMVDMAKEFTSCAMTNHVHVKLYKNDKVIDPTSYV